MAKRIHELGTTITEFRSGDAIAVGNSGEVDAQISSDNLTRIMSQGALTKDISASLYFTTNDYLEIADAASLTLPDAGLSIGCVIKPDGTLSADSGIVSKDDGTNREYAFFLDEDGANDQIKVVLYDSGTDTNYSEFTALTGGDLFLGKTQSLLFVWNGSTGTIYRNGQPLTTTKTDTGTGFSSFSDTTAPVRIGRVAAGNYFEGYISRVTLFDDDLTAAEALDWHEGNVGFISTDLVADWRAQNYIESTDELLDASGNDLDASNNGATIVGTPNPLIRQGSFTPGFEFGGGNTGMTISVQTGKWQLRNGKVHIRGTLTLTAKGSSTGSARLTGLPFTVETESSSPNGILLGWANGGSAWSSVITCLCVSNDTKLGFYEWGSTGASGSLQETDFQDTFSCRFNGEYWPGSVIS